MEELLRQHLCNSSLHLGLDPETVELAIEGVEVFEGSYLDDSEPVEEQQQQPPRKRQRHAVGAPTPPATAPTATVRMEQAITSLAEQQAGMVTTLQELVTGAMNVCFVFRIVI